MKFWLIELNEPIKFKWNWLFILIQVIKTIETEKIQQNEYLLQNLKALNYYTKTIICQRLWEYY